MKFIFIFYILVISCKHTDFRNNESLFKINDIYKLKSNCQNLNKSANMSFYSEDNLEANFIIEWESKTKTFDLYVLSPIGSEIGFINYRNNKFNFSKNLKKYIKDIKINSNGFILYKNININISAMEIPCILSNKIPENWLKNIKFIKKGLDYYKYKSKYIDLIKFKNKKNICINYYIKSFVFKRQINWCFDKNESDINLNYFNIKWKNIGN